MRTASKKVPKQSKHLLVLQNVFNGFHIKNFGKKLVGI